MILEQPRMVRQGRVVRDQHTAFACSNDFISVETEAAHRAHAANSGAAIFAAMGLTSVFDHIEAMLVGNGANLIHMGGMTKEMDDNDCPRLSGDRFFNARRI